MSTWPKVFPFSEPSVMTVPMLSPALVRSPMSTGIRVAHSRRTSTLSGPWSCTSASQARALGTSWKFARPCVGPIFSVAPTRRTRRIIPMMKAKSPMRLVMNAFRPAKALSVSWYQKPISR